MTKSFISSPGHYYHPLSSISISQRDEQQNSPCFSGTKADSVAGREPQMIFPGYCSRSIPHHLLCRCVQMWGWQPPGLRQAHFRKRQLPGRAGYGSRPSEPGNSKDHPHLHQQLFHEPFICRSYVNFLECKFSRVKFSRSWKIQKGIFLVNLQTKIQKCALGRAKGRLHRGPSHGCTDKRALRGKCIRRAAGMIASRRTQEILTRGRSEATDSSGARQNYYFTVINHLGWERP